MENISDLTNEELVLLATLIALQITKNKTEKEIKKIKYLCSQILSTLNTLTC